MEDYPYHSRSSCGCLIGEALIGLALIALMLACMSAVNLVGGF